MEGLEQRVQKAIGWADKLHYWEEKRQALTVPPEAIQTVSVVDRNGEAVFDADRARCLLLLGIDAARKNAEREVFELLQRFRD